MKLEVGMYVRTKWGCICELININEFREPSMKYGVEANYLRDVMFIGDEDILKASDNIIDLIEVGDYVNGKLVVDKWEEPDWYGYFIKLEGEKTIPTIRKIESVVTKEQFESMSYKVERG
jgi:hypothetical protein